MDEAVFPIETRSQTPVLAGIEALRLGSSLAGDFLCQMLEDAGATISRFDPGRTAPVTARIVINDLGRGAAVPEGLSFDALAPGRPDLVYCSLVSFPEGGPTGLPELEDDPILSVLGINRPAGGAPIPETLRIPSFYGAEMAAIYIACALMPRNRRGRAQFIEAPLASITLNILGRQLVSFDDPRLKDPLVANHMLPIFQLRKCADGRWVQPQGRYPNLCRTLFRAVGRPEWADAAAAGLENLPDRASVEMWNKRLDAIFLERPAAEWERIINEAGGSCTLCRTYEEWMAEEQPYRSGIFRSGSAATGVRVGPGFVVESGPPAGRTGRDPARRTADGARPLDGIRVLDFCIVIAGPTTARILADLGADVVKVDAPDRVVNSVLWMDINRGKRSIVLDLRCDEARDVAAELAARSDVVVENFRKGKISPFGLDYGSVTKANPGVVYASANLFDQTGPWANRPGWDHNAQAASGMQMGRVRDGAPHHMSLPVNDYGTGLFGALAVVLGLLHRQLTGKGARVAVSLARSASFLQQAHYAGPAAPKRPVRDKRTLACKDGWVTVFASDAGALPPPDLTADAGGSSAEAVLARLGAAGFAAVRENSPAELARQDWVAEAGLRVGWSQPEFGPFRQGFPHGAMEGFDLSPRRPAPSPGADNAAILAEIGLGGRMNDLTAIGAVQSFSLFRDGL